MWILDRITNKYVLQIFYNFFLRWPPNSTTAAQIMLSVQVISVSVRFFSPYNATQLLVRRINLEAEGMLCVLFDDIYQNKKSAVALFELKFSLSLLCIYKYSKKLSFIHSVSTLRWLKNVWGMFVCVTFHWWLWFMWMKWEYCLKIWGEKDRNRSFLKITLTRFRLISKLLSAIRYQRPSVRSNFTRNTD